MNHSYPVDYFALGVIAFEFMTGKVHNFVWRGRMLEPTENKLDKKYWQNKFNLIKFHLMDGVGKA